MRSVLLASSLLGLAEARSRASFDFGWRYILGDQGFVPSAAVAAARDTDPGAGFCGFAENITGTQCYGLTSYSATTIDECAATCCLDYSCNIWQWQEGNSGGPCWGGSDCSQNTSSAWVSFRRAGPPPGPPGPGPVLPPCTDASKPCAPGFSDDSWRTVNTPHDFIVEGVADQNADRGHGYLPFNKSWYRKEFSVPTTAQGQLVWLDFDGVYKHVRSNMPHPRPPAPTSNPLTTPLGLGQLVRPSAGTATCGSTGLTWATSAQDT